GFPLNEPPSPPFPDKPLLHDPRTTVEFTNATPGRPFYADRAAINTAMGAAPTARLEIDHAVVFRHDATDITKQWPHLIRIRYRLHDDRGEVESAGNNGEREQGMWFEQLIQVQ